MPLEAGRMPALLWFALIGDAPTQKPAFLVPRSLVCFLRMSTITAILEADNDGTLHLPVPAELRHCKVKVEANVEAAPGRIETGHRQPKARRRKIIATPEMIEQRMAAFARVRELNPFRDIKDPVAWQREMREDVKLPGRD